MVEISYPILESNGISIDKNKYTVTVNGKANYIPKMLFDLLYYFMSNTERIISRDELLINVWKNVNVDIRTVDVHITHLRRLIGKHNIVTIIKVGYLWQKD